MRAGALAAVLAAFLLVPWVSWDGAVHWRVPGVVSGDEPHYLLTTYSLLLDHDLLLQDDYAKVHQGSARAGARFRGDELDHHTVLVDPQTGAHALWQDVFDWHTHLKEGGFARLQPGFETAVEVPAHPAGFPALVALMLWPVRNGNCEPFAVEAVALLSFLSLLALAFMPGFTAREITAAVLLAGFASPVLAYARSYFSEPAIACALAFALLAYARRRPALAGALCFAAATMKAPYGLVALGWTALLYKEGRREDAKRLFATFAVGCAALAAFNWRLAHTPFVSGTVGFVLSPGPGNLADLFFSNAHGVFTFAPWAIAGTFALPREMRWGALPVVLLIGLADVQAGGFCYGPRYLVPFLPWLALATVQAFRRASRRWRAAMVALAALGFVIAVPGALRYADLFDRPVAAEFWPPPATTVRR